MNYEKITANEVYVKGLSIRTSNAENNFAALWETFLRDPFFEKKGALYGAYHTYSSDEKGGFTFTVGEETMEKSADALCLPAGKYYKFHASTREEIAGLWQYVWQTPLPRAFTCDYEKYNADGSVDLFIGVK